LGSGDIGCLEIMAMKMSENGLRLLAQWEGFRRAAYDDVAGYKTIGVGHLLTAEEMASGILKINRESVKWRDCLTDDEVLVLLAQDITPREDVINDCVAVSLEQCQFDALVSFVFNIGDGAFKKSTLLRLINQETFSLVPEQFMRWNKAGGRIVAGLNNRRMNEVKLWQGELS
jgi:lysozyme